MKKVVFLLALGMTLGFAFTAQAQKKTGYINSQELLESMPEAKKADSSIAKYAKELEDQMKTMVTDYQGKLKDFDEKGKTWSEAVKEVKGKEIQDLQNRIQEFQQGADDKLGKKRQELLKPIFDKAQQAIKAVGAEGSYDYIYDGSALLYVNPSEDVMPKVKAKLGIK